MGWEIVKQPGTTPQKYARFSTVVMCNTHDTMSYNRMLQVLKEEYRMSDEAARVMLDEAPNALYYEPPFRSGKL